MTTNKAADSMPRAIQVWLHPKREARRIASQAEEIANLTKEVEALGMLRKEKRELEAELSEAEARIAEEEEKVKKMRKDSDSLNASIGTLMGECGRQRNLVKELETKLAAAERELAEREEASVQIAEFEKTLGKVEEMKAKYEQRIQRLRAAVTELRRNPGRENREAPVARRDESDWLEALP